ncbi:MAG: glycine cleavage system aminomethyltransferase GcvT [Gammaproteobacteria bacterium]
MPGAKQTPLYETHIGLGAHMVEFGGWSMPLYYASQIDEHHAVRKHAGLFDVSHMTVVDVSGADAERFLRYVLANDVIKLRAAQNGPCQALYSCMLRDDGGILDDLIVYGLSDDGFRLVVNAATRDKDLAWLSEQAGGRSLELLERPDLAMLAVQGPQARELVARTLPSGEALLALAPFRAHRDDDTLVARTGYTGEDGFEIIVAGAQTPALWAELQASGIVACGLGARDTLRLEAGLNLYGLDMDETVSPLECGLGWTVDMKTDRDFVGRSALERQAAVGVKFEQAGLILEGKGVIRAGYAVRTSGGEGEVTSGTFSPTLARSVALARLPVDVEKDGEVVIRNRRHAVRIVKPPFVRHGEIQVDL